MLTWMSRVPSPSSPSRKGVRSSPRTSFASPAADPCSTPTIDGLPLITSVPVAKLPPLCGENLRAPSSDESSKRLRFLALSAAAAMFAPRDGAGAARSGLSVVTGGAGGVTGNLCPYVPAKLQRTWRENGVWVWFCHLKSSSVEDFCVHTTNIPIKVHFDTNTPPNTPTKLKQRFAWSPPLPLALNCRRKTSLVERHRQTKGVGEKTLSSCTRTLGGISMKENHRLKRNESTFSIYKPSSFSLSLSLRVKSREHRAHAVVAVMLVQKHDLLPGLLYSMHAASEYFFICFHKKPLKLREYNIHMHTNST